MLRLQAFIGVVAAATTFAAVGQNEVRERAAHIEGLFAKSVVYLDVVGLTDDDPPKEIRHRSGTGFVVNERGYILTVAHIFPPDGLYKGGFVAHARQNSAKDADVDTPDLLTIDRLLDIALLQLHEKRGVRWYPVPLGTSNWKSTAPSIVVFGYPSPRFELAKEFGGVTKTQTSFGWMGIDAKIEDGYSGGPVFNMDAQVIGIAVAGYRGANGEKYAIPINHAYGLLGIAAH